MAIFKSEKQLNEFMDAGIRGLVERFGMDESEIAKGEDFCRTLMAEYSRLLAEGKIKRPYTFSANAPEDSTVEFMVKNIFSGRRAVNDVKAQ